MTSTWSKFGILILGLSFLAASCTQGFSWYDDGDVTLAGQKISVDVAKTVEQRTQGLSDRASMSSSQGMLFIIEPESAQSFWMKDMKFAIDIVWINNGKVVGIVKDAKPEPGVEDSKLKVYRSPGSVDMVLELSSGWSDQNVLKVGDVIVTKLNP